MQFAFHLSLKSDKENSTQVESEAEKTKLQPSEDENKQQSESEKTIPATPETNATTLTKPPSTVEIPAPMPQKPLETMELNPPPTPSISSFISEFQTAVVSMVSSNFILHPDTLHGLSFQFTSLQHQPTRVINVALKDGTLTKVVVDPSWEIYDLVSSL